MNFQLSIWNKYRSNSQVLGAHIQSFKDKRGIIKMNKEQLEGYVADITCILKECRNYMDECNLTMPDGLWKYDRANPTTHPSKKIFLYKDCMSKQAIKKYGREFMAN